MPRKTIPNRQPKSPEPADYKNRATFTFKGLTYRYDKHYGEWHLVDKRVSLTVPRTLYSYGNGKLWGASMSGGAETPAAALQKWLDSLIDLRTREAKEAEQHAKDLRAAVRQLKARRWI